MAQRGVQNNNKGCRQSLCGAQVMPTLFFFFLGGGVFILTLLTLLSVLSFLSLSLSFCCAITKKPVHTPIYLFKAAFIIIRSLYELQSFIFRMFFFK